MKNPYSEIILGTAQIGKPYGLGKWMHHLMTEKEAFALLDAAWEQGITTIDTSPEYGIAEKRICMFLKKNPNKNFHIISKIKSIPNDDEKIDLSLRRWLNACPFLKSHNCASISLLLHRETDIYRNAVVEALTNIVTSEKFLCWGVSVYDDETARYASTIANCGIVQLPFNILNQSFGRLGVIEQLSSQKKIVMARSIFSQGILQRNKKMPVILDKSTINLLNKLYNLLDVHDFLINDFALATAKLEKGLDHFVLGADTPDQIKTWKIEDESLKKVMVFSEINSQLRNHSSEMLKPQNWKFNVS